MTGFDGTGLLGLGPMTGRGMGYCVLPLSNPGVGRVPYGYAGIYGAQLPTTYPYAPVIPYWRPWFGMRPGYGWGRGGRWVYPYGAGYYGALNAGSYYGAPYAPQMDPQQEADMLKDQAKAMQEEIHAINDRISELESAAKEEKKK